jgi:LacI family gluconate utilization system Gnt-I transcriptional repressor
MVLRMPGRAEIATGIVAARELLAATPRIDAAAFSNDVLALGALFECQRLGEPVPRRLALAGFGNLEAAAHATPRITSVAPPSARIGEVTGQAVFDESLRRRQAIDLGFELIERETSAP